MAQTEYVLCNYNQTKRYYSRFLITSEIILFISACLLPIPPNAKITSYIGLFIIWGILVGFSYLLERQFVRSQFHLRIDKDGLYIEALSAIDINVSKEQADLITNLGLSYSNQINLPNSFSEDSHYVSWGEISEITKFRQNATTYYSRWAPIYSYTDIQLALTHSPKIRTPKRIQVLNDDLPLFKIAVERLAPENNPLKELLNHL